MRLATFPWRSRAAGVAALAVGLLIAPGCGLDKDDPAPLNGPSETGLSVELRALPDTVNADGVSQSVVEMVLRDQNGNPAPGRAVLFELLRGNGRIVPSADSTYVGPVQNPNALVMATSDAGTAVIVYVAGFGARDVLIGVRPYNYDLIGTGFWRTVAIVQL